MTTSNKTPFTPKNTALPRVYATDALVADSPEYLAAIEAHNAASRAYRAVVVAHRAGKVSDETLAEARRIRDAANLAFDQAYSTEQERARPETILASYKI